MSTHKAHRFRIYPTPEQEREFRRISGCCRLVYNLGLSQRADFWRQHLRKKGKHISLSGQRAELSALKAEAPFLAEAPAHCLQVALINLDKAFDRFFKGLGGYPRYKRKGAADSFCFPDPAQIRIRGRGDSVRLILPKFGKTKKDRGPIAIRLHRPITGRIRQVTISREGRHWYAAVTVRLRANAPEYIAPVSPDEVVGIDRNALNPFVTSEGRLLGHEIEGKRERQKKSRLQKNLARTKRGSRRRRKAQARLAAHNAKMARRRRDMIHKITDDLAKNNRVAVIENLPVQAMTASASGTVEAPGRNVAAKAGLNRTVLDKGWGEFRRQLGYKMVRYGGLLIEVPAAYSSQTCEACLHVAAESRNGQRFFCVACGHEAHADINAAKEIRRRGLRLLGLDARRQEERDLPPAGTVGAARGAQHAVAEKREEKPGPKRAGWKDGIKMPVMAGAESLGAQAGD